MNTQWPDSGPNASPVTVWSMFMWGLISGCERMLALERDWTRLCHYSRPGNAKAKWLDAVPSPVSVDRMRPVDEKHLWNVSVCDRMLGDGEFGRSTRRGVRLRALGAVGAQR
jgi:hypothetical protein